MKNLLPIFLPLLVSYARAQDSGNTWGAEMTQRPFADEWDMHLNMVRPRSGLCCSQGTPTTVSTQYGQKAQIQTMAEFGIPASSGPSMEHGTRNGIFIPDAVTRHETEAVVQENTAWTAGHREDTILPCYGTSSLWEIPDIHRSITKQ